MQRGLRMDLDTLFEPGLADAAKQHAAELGDIVGEVPYNKEHESTLQRVSVPRRSSRPMAGRRASSVPEAP